MTWPVHTEQVAHFVAYLSITGKALSTTKTYLAGLSAEHKLRGMSDPTDEFLIKKLLKGFAKNAKNTDSRFPITFERLKLLIGCVPNICRDTYEASLFKTAFTLAFFGCFRLSELVGQGTSLEAKGGRSGITVSDVRIEMPTAKVRISASKTDQMADGHTVTLHHIPSASQVCPVLALAEYSRKRPGTTGPFLIHNCGSPLTRYQFHAVLKKAASFLGWPIDKFASHSFRIGATTTAILNGASERQIKQLGRWKSAAWKSYCRPDRA